MMATSKLFALLGLGLSLPLSACTGGEAAPADQAAVAAPAAAPAPAEAETAPAGEIIEVKMVTDGSRNYFEPAEITASRGDVIRYVLASGVHNVSFPADKNASAAGLPAPTAYLAQPGQSVDVVVDLAPGSYTFQCDPHAVLGMVGTLTVR